MSVFYAVVMLVYGVLAWRVAHPSDEQLRRRGQRFAGRHLAYVDSEFVPFFDRFTRWSHWVAGTAFLSMGAGIFVLHWVDKQADPFPVVYAGVIGLASTAWAVVRLRLAGREFPVSRHWGGLARPRRVTLSDYVPPSVQVLTWLVLAAVVTVTFDLAGSAQPWRDGLSVRIGSTAAVVLLAAAGCSLFAFGRTMCERPQPAMDPCHLYFQDAWRSEFLLGAFAFLCFGAFAYLSVIGFYVDLPGWLDSIGFQALTVAGVGYLVAFIRSSRHFRERLWPTLAPGQVLLPGEPVPPRQGVAA
jgi:hypothetical protein